MVLEGKADLQLRATKTPHPGHAKSALSASTKVCAKACLALWLWFPKMCPPASTEPPTREAVGPIPAACFSHAVGALEIARRAEDQRYRRARDGLGTLALFEVVHVEKHAGVWLHLAQPLLDDAHLVLTGAPHVRQKEMELCCSDLRSDDKLLALYVAQEVPLVRQALQAAHLVIVQELQD